MSDVYIVTSGTYSDYGINQVFKSREKAELYCDCHEGCEIETWEFHDDYIYTTYDYIDIIANIYLENNKCSILCDFKKGAIEDNPSDRDCLCAFAYINPNYRKEFRRVEIYLARELPKNYSRMQLENKWVRLIEDLAAEIRYEFSGVDSVDDRIVTEFVKRRLGVKEGEYEE